MLARRDYHESLAVGTDPYSVICKSIERTGQDRVSSVHQLSTILGYVSLIDCVKAAFTNRKRAIHDMIAGSYCVWKVA
jgi:hypothetical protein